MSREVSCRTNVTICGKIADKKIGGEYCQQVSIVFYVARRSYAIREKSNYNLLLKISFAKDKTYL